MADECHRLRAEGDDRQRPILWWIGHDADVRLVVHDRLDDLVRMQALELDADLGVERHEPLQVMAHVMQSDGINGGHADGAVDLGLDRGDLRLRLFPGFEHPAAGQIEALPLGGHGERPTGAVDEAHAQLTLELLDGLAGRRLGDVVDLGAAGEAPEPDDVAVEAKGLEMHRIAILHNQYYLYLR